MALSFLFGGNTQETPETLARKRAVAQALAVKASNSPKNVGEGLSAIGNALLYRSLMGQVDTADAAGRKAADSDANTAFTKYFGDLGGSSIPASGAQAEVGATSPSTVTPGGVPEVSDYIKQAAIARGIDPDIALRVAGHEGLNVFDPSKPDNGGDEGSSFGPFQLHYAGMSKSMPNAGLGDEFTKATGLKASDPSTWKQQVDFALDQARKGGWSPWMGAKAEGITGMMGIGNSPANARTQVPNQVASLDPAAGIPTPGAGAQIDATNPASAKPDVPAALAGPQSTVAPAAPSTVANALAGPPKAATATSQPPQTAQNGPSAALLFKVLSNPYSTASQKAMAQFLLEKQQQQSDPLRQLQVQELQTKIDQAKNPLPEYDFQKLDDGTIIRTEKRGGTAQPVYQAGVKPVIINNRLVDPQGGKVLADFSDPKTAVVDGKVVDTITGKVLYDGTPPEKWTKLDGTTLFNEKTGDTKPVAPNGKPGGFRFAGESIEGQALNGLMDSGQLTETQAQQIASGKQITGPNGEILFMTPQGLVSQPANGGQPKVVSPAVAPAPAQNEGIKLFPDEPKSPSPSAVVEPSASAPAATDTPVPVQGQQKVDAQNVPNGAVQLTGPKAPNKDELDAAGYADRLAEAEKVIGGLEDVGASRLQNLESSVPLVGNSLVSSDFQKFDQARRNFINAQLRRESGAVIGPSEFAEGNRQYFPQPGDSKEVLAQKRAARATAIANMARSAGPTYKAAPSQTEPVVINGYTIQKVN